MTAQEAINKIAAYLLGKDWYSYYTNHDDINGEIVETICSRYSCKDEDPVDKWRRKHKRCYFCRHVKYLDNPRGTGAYQCQAKTKLVNIEIPRPFRGEKENIDYGIFNGTLKGFDYVQCENCGAEIHGIHKDGKCIESIELWNRRVDNG